MRAIYAFLITDGLWTIPMMILLLLSIHCRRKLGCIPAFVLLGGLVVVLEVPQIVCILFESLLRMLNHELYPVPLVYSLSPRRYSYGVGSFIFAMGFYFVVLRVMAWVFRQKNFRAQ